MSKRDFPLSPLMLAGIVGVGLLAWYIIRKGGVGRAAVAAGSAVGGAAVNAVGGVVSGAVGAVSQATGIPAPSETTTDPRVARWIIDHYGYLTASQWAGVPALFSALALPKGSGTPPPAGSAAYNAMPEARTIDVSATPPSGDGYTSYSGEW